MSSHKNDDDKSERQPSISDDTTTSNPAGPEAKNVGRKRTIDESLLDSEERSKLESRRAYNRLCASKARKRSKELVEHLQNQVEELTKDKAELQHGNELMRAQLELLEQQNRTLLINQLASQGMISAGQGIGGGHQAFGGLGAALGAGPFLGQVGSGGVGNGASVSLLGRLTLERMAAQNRLQQLQAQQSLSDGMGNGKNNNINGNQSNGNNGRDYLG